MKYTRTTISIPEHVLALGQQRAAAFRLSFSDYLARLVEEEALSKRVSMSIVAETPPPFRIVRETLSPRQLALKRQAPPPARKTPPLSSPPPKKPRAK